MCLEFGAKPFPIIIMDILTKRVFIGRLMIVVVNDGVMISCGSLRERVVHDDGHSNNYILQSSWGEFRGEWKWIQYLDRARIVECNINQHMSKNKLNYR